MSNKVESPVSLNTRERTEEEQEILNEQLLIACKKGENELVIKLLDKGADINYCSDNGWTVLGAAAANGRTETIRLLISRQELDINKRGIDEMNALHWACDSGSINCSRLLINAGIDLQATDKDGDDAVLCACQSAAGSIQLLELLVKHRLSLLSSVNKDGRNAMHMACDYNRIHTIKYLLERGFSLDSPQDKDGKTPRMMLDETHDEDVKQFLEELKSQDNTETPATTESTDYAPYLEKAASKGTVITRQSSLGLFGAAGTGKTSTLRLITGQPPVDVHDSTPILKPAEYFSNDDKVHSNEPSESEGEDDEWNSDKELADTPSQSTAKKKIVAHMERGLLIEWKPATQEVLLERLANCTVTALELEKMANDRNAQTCLLIEGLPMTKNENQIERDPIDKPLEDDNGATPKLLSKQSSASSAYNEISEKIFKFLESNKPLKPLGITHFISTCDTGGQAAFLDVAPAFIRYNSFNLVLLKLDENLDDPAQFFYSVKGKRVGDEKRQVSTRALVHSFVSSKSKIRKPSMKGMKVIKQSQKPKFMILGTHFDKYKQKLGECQSKEEKNRVLREDLANFGDCLVRNNDTKIMFSLNTLARDKANEILASKIRNLVMENYTETEIPVSWYIFQLAMIKVQTSHENQGMIHLSQLIAIGTVSKMVPKEVEACLLYFHDLQVCLYFPKVVPNVVFTNPQFLFDKISEIIAYTFRSGTGEIDTEFDNLKKHGKFTETFLKHICKGFHEDFFSSQNFLALMSHLFVVCALPGTDEYFMPCVLATHTNPCKGFSKCSMKPLALTWDKSVPNGLFPSLTTKIQAHNSINDIRFTMSRVEQQYRNKITLDSVNLGCNVTLVECTSFIAASINTCIPLTPDSDSYVKVRGIILRCIDDIVNRLDWVQVEPEECFICDMCPSECPVHLCYPNKSLTVLSCGMTETKVTLTSSHLPWRKGKFNNPQLLDLDNDCNDVVIVLTPVHYMWEDI